MRRIVSGIMLTLFLASMLTLAFNIQPVKASGTIYIRADGSVEPDTAPISSLDNVTYTFTGNIHESIVVERDNIVLDGAGYRIEGPGTYPDPWGSIGITMIGRSKITIRNMEIRAFEYGIWVNKSSSNMISGNDITNNGLGIWIFHSLNNIINENNIINNNYGVFFEISSNNKFYHNNFIDNTHKVYGHPSGYANFWDEGYPSGGNYWSDYTDVDLFSGSSQDEAGSDGIWDSSYVIDDDNVDRYPFTQQDGWEAPSIPPDLTVFDPEIDGLTLTVNGVVLPGTPGTTITKIHWDWGDGNSEDHWFPASHTYTDYGDYTITVTAYQSDGLTSTKTKQVSLRQPTPIPEAPLGTILLTSIAFVAYVATAKWRRKRQQHNL